MRNLEIAMASAGVGWDDVVRRTIYTTEPTAYEVITSAIDEVTVVPTTRQTSWASRPRGPGCMIEIECTAVTD